MRNFFLRIPLFRNLAENSIEFQYLIDNSEMLPVSGGTPLFQKGDTADRVFIIYSGEVGIYNGDQLIAMQRRGSLCGEVSLLSGSVHSSTAKAAFDSIVIEIPGSAFVSLIESAPTVGRELIKILSERFRGSLDSSNKPSFGRICVIQYPELQNRSGLLAFSLSRAVKNEGGESIIVTLNQLSPLITEKERNQIEQLQTHLNKSNHLPVILNLELFFDDQSTTSYSTLRDLLSGLRRSFNLVLVDLSLVSSSITQLVKSMADEVLIVYRKVKPKIDVNTINIKVLREISPTYNYKQAELPTFIGLHRDPAVNKSMHQLARKLMQITRGLCLGGGGARALAHIGCLEVFEEERIDFDFVSGSSMGAVIGAMYALGMPMSDVRRLVARNLADSDAILDKSLPFVSFFRGSKLNRLLENIFRNIRIEDMPMPFFCNSADLESGQMVTFDSGWLDFALRCSVSLPGIYPPVKWNHRTLVDGSVINNLPADILKQQGASRIVGINVSPLTDPLSAQTELDERQGIKGIYNFVSLPPILKIVTRSIAIANRDLMKSLFNDFDFLINPELTHFDLFDFHKQIDIINAGRIKAKSELNAMIQSLRRPTLK
ncbi:MAG: patatin-like phospholipase family protein [Leptonema sp. (in: Bacteria)]|nr:patatin-like phospholipase family protein [Leptonema sp. (in: bacteria)]